MDNDIIFESNERLFSKKQIISSKRFKNRKDILNALLSPCEKYSFESAQQIIDNYMKGKVN